MVTLKGYTGNINCLSTDSKPTTKVDINTILRELDTNKYYYFDGTTWNQIPSSGGGGGGGDITSANVTAMTGYEIATEAEDIETTDTLNEAVGKVEYRVGQNESNISSLYDHITFSANSKMYYLQPEQPSSPSDGDIWIW